MNTRNLINYQTYNDQIFYYNGKVYTTTTRFR